MDPMGDVWPIPRRPTSLHEASLHLPTPKLSIKWWTNPWMEVGGRTVGSGMVVARRPKIKVGNLWFPCTVLYLGAFLDPGSQWVNNLIIFILWRSPYFLSLSTLTVSKLYGPLTMRNTPQNIAKKHPISSKWIRACLVILFWNSMSQKWDKIGKKNINFWLFQCIGL